MFRARKQQSRESYTHNRSHSQPSTPGHRQRHSSHVEVQPADTPHDGRLTSPTHQSRRKSSSQNRPQDLPFHLVGSSSTTPTATTESDGSYTIVYHRIRWLRRPTQQSQHSSSSHSESYQSSQSPRDIHNAYNYLPVPAAAPSFRAIREAAEAQIPASGRHERLWEWDDGMNDWILQAPKVWPGRKSSSRQDTGTGQTQRRMLTPATDDAHHQASREDRNREERRAARPAAPPPSSPRPNPLSARATLGTEKTRRRSVVGNNENESIRQSFERSPPQQQTVTARARSKSESKTYRSSTATTTATTPSAKSNSPLTNSSSSSDHHRRHRSVSQASHQATLGRDTGRDTGREESNRTSRPHGQDRAQARGDGRSSAHPEDKRRYRPRYVEPSVGRRGQRVRFTPSTKGAASSVHRNGSSREEVGGSTKDQRESRK